LREPGKAAENPALRSLANKSKEEKLSLFAVKWLELLKNGKTSKKLSLLKNAKPVT